MSEEEERNNDGSSEEDEVSLELVLSLPESFFEKFSTVEGYEELVSKIKDYVETKETELIDYQNTVREFEENLEERDNNIRAIEVDHKTSESDNIAIREKCASLEEEVILLKQGLSTANDNLTETSGELEPIKQESHDRQVTIEELEEELRMTKQELELSRCPPDIPGADRDELLRILDRRQMEITRLTEDWKKLSEKLEEATSDKYRVQSHLDNLSGQEASLQLKEQIFEREKQLLQQQNEWLSREVEAKGDLVLSLKKELAVVTTDMETYRSVKTTELEHLNESLVVQRGLVEELQGRLDGANKKLLEQREEHVEVEDQLRRELLSQTRLSTLYQSASEDGEGMVTELMGKIRELQSSLNGVTFENNTLKESNTSLQEQYDMMTCDSSARISALEDELRNANELLKVHSEVLPLTTTDTGLSLTQMYTKYVESTSRLSQEREENARLNNYLAQILQELEEKTPVLQKLRRDHDLLVRTNEEMQQRMQGIAEESETLRIEAEESLKFSRVIERENKRLKSLTADLGRQVKTLLRECEEARGGVASLSHTSTFDLGEVSSSSEVISQHLVEYRNIAELQEQNQKLLAVVRELGEERESEEMERESTHLSEMKTSLDDALKEIEGLRTSRERQKEMVESIVKQRDMYRVLLAQSTPLPADDNSQLHVSKDSSSLFKSPQKSMAIDNEAFGELKEQFEAYRREKVENDRILQEQMDTYREESSKLRLDNAKLTSKLEYADDRYQMLDTAYKGAKKELTALSNKESQLMSLLTRHQTTVDTLNKELFSSKDRLTRLEVKKQSLRVERDSLYESEKRSREMYEQVSREKQGQAVLMTNLQTIQNNMERNEYELKQRFSSRIEGLEKENVLLKERNHGYEERRTQMREAYEKQVQELTFRLDEVSESKRETEECLATVQEELERVRMELADKTSSLTLTVSELEENKDRLLAMEEDAGVEFRSKIRTLERQLGDSNAKVTRLTEEARVAEQHCEEYRKMSEVNEQSLRELNETCDEFKTKMSEDLERMKENELVLVKERDEERERREREVDELKQELLETQEALSQTQDRIESLQAMVDDAESALETGMKEVAIAKGEAKRFSDINLESQELYQRELVQHGKTMEELTLVRMRLEEKGEAEQEARNEREKVAAELQSVMASVDDRENRLIAENDTLKARCHELTQQNELSHSEIERMSARIVTLTQQEYALLDEGVEQGAELQTRRDDDSSNLLEIVRFVKREKEIAETKRDMAETECRQLKNSVQRMERELKDSQSQLQELTETAKLYEESTVEYQEVMAKVQTLNVVSDSNTLLRDERNRLLSKVQELEDRVRDSNTQLLSSRETQRQLSAQKDSLLAEKAALRNEVERWNKRTSQLIEQYNKIDPEEYKKLLEEKDAHEMEIEKLSLDLTRAREECDNERKRSEEEVAQLNEQLQLLRQQSESKDSDLSLLAAENKTIKEELAEKTKLNGKLRELGRKYRGLYEEKKKESEELLAQKEVGDKQLEELKEASSKPPVEDVSVELRQQLETTKQELETVKAKFADKDDKFNKVVKTAKSLKIKYETIKKEKEDLSKALDDAKSAHDDQTKALEDLKTEHETQTAAMKETLQSEHSTITRELEEKIERLEEDLRTKKRSRVVPPQVVESTSTTVPLPSAAVRPTVTTTPTASIRPMPLQVTTAPTAHVTPTQVSTSVPSTMEATPTTLSNTGSATMFVRSSSPQVSTGPRPSQQIPSTSTSSSISEADNTSRPSVKRSREDIANEYPPSKRKVQTTPQEMEASTTTTDSDATTSRVESSDSVSPDTQTLRDHTPNDQTPPPSSMGVADLPATIPADTTSDEATEPVDETGLTSSNVVYEDDNEVMNDNEDMLEDNNHNQEDEEEGDGEEMVVLATEPLESASVDAPAHSREECDEGERGREGEEEESQEDEDDMEGEGEEGEEEEGEYEIEGEEMDVGEFREERSPSVLVVVAEESVGLPDDEVTVDLPSPQQVIVDNATIRHQPYPATHRLRLQMGDSRAHTPGVLDVVQEDHQVPCTPVLAEDKQLGKTQSVPAEHNINKSLSDSSSIAMADNPSSLTTIANQDSNVGVGSLDDVTMTTVGDALPEDRPQTSDGGIGEDGNIHDEVIEEIIGSDSSSDEEDVEDGQLIDSPSKQDSEVQQFPPPTSSSIQTTPIPSAQLVTISSSGLEEGTSSSTGGDVEGTKPTRPRLQRITWSQPATQSGSNEPKKAPKPSGLRRPSRGSHRGRSKGRGIKKQ